MSEREAELLWQREAVAIQQLRSKPWGQPDANPVRSIDWSKLEKLIGERWLSIVGGLAMIIGIGFFVSFAAQQGWFAKIPGSVRCGMGGAIGVLLLAGGAWARRKVNDWASVGLTIAGLGALYASSYAAYALYELMSPGATFLVLVGVAGVGLAISAMTNLFVIGLTSLLGAYMAPFLASSGQAGYVYLPAYWGGLLAVGQVLSLTKRGRFSICRWFTSCATLLLGAGWVLKFGTKSPELGLGMLGGVWLMAHAESVFTAVRTDRKLVREFDERDLARLVENPRFFRIFHRLRLRPLVSISHTAWAAGFGVWIARETHIVPESLPTAALGIAALALGVGLRGPMGFLEPRPVTRIGRLVGALAITAGTLLVASIAIALSGFAQVYTLTAVGLAALLAGRLLRTQVLDIYSALVLLFAAVRVVAYDSWATSHGGAIDVLGFHLTEWAGACFGVAAAWLVYAGTCLRTLARGDRSAEHNSLLPASTWSHIATFALGLGIVLAWVSLLHQDASVASICSAWMGMAVSLAIAAQFRMSDGLRVATGAALAAAILVCVTTTWWTPKSGQMELYGLVLRGRMAVPFATAGVSLFIAWLFAENSVILLRIGRVFAGIATILIAAGISHRDSETLSLCYAWLGACWLVTGLARVVRHLWLAIDALGIWLLACGGWISEYAVVNWAGSSAPPLLHPGLWLAFALAFSVLGLWRVNKGALADQAFRALVIAGWGCTVIIWVATSREVERLAQMLPIEHTARGAAVSLWWGVFAIGLLIAGFVRHLPPVRWVGLGLLGLATLKALVFDLARVPTGWRGVSIFLLGLLLVGVGLAYVQIAKRMEASAPREDTSN